MQKNTNEMPLYPPSFIDKFMRFFQRLSIPYWLTYLLLFTLESVINHVLAWIDGWLPVSTFNKLLLVFPLWQWGTLAAITYLNITSEAILPSFRELLDIDDDRLEKLKYEFTTLPTRGVILSGILWILAYLVLTYLSYDTIYVRYGFGNAFKVFIFLEGLIGYSTGSVIYYHSIRQLWLVSRTVKMIKQFNLFRLGPVYAFSRLTSQTGISWMFLLGLTLLLFPLDLAKGLSVAILGFQVMIALVAFVLPLRFVYYHLVLEKRKLLGELNQQIELTVKRLHHSLDKDELDDAAQIGNALMGLNSEREILMDISTWPWRTGTLTAFLSAVFLPIVLLLIQIVIQKWLGV
jgi:hypothetical protein